LRPKNIFICVAKKIANEMIFLLQPCKIKNEIADLHEPDAMNPKKIGGDSHGSKKEKRQEEVTIQ
jgi:hypothetical protein